MTLLMQPTDALRTVRELITAAVTWWVIELEEMVPTCLKNFLRKTRPLLVLTQEQNKIIPELRIGSQLHALPPIAFHPTSEEIECFKSSLEQKIGASEPKILLELDDKSLLLIQANYPLSAEPNIAKILPNELNRITPFSPEDVYWDWTVKNRDIQNNQLAIEIAITRRHIVDSIRSSLRKYSLFPNEVRHRSLEKISTSYLHLLPKQRGFHIWKDNKLNTTLNSALLVSLLLLLGAIVYHPARQLEKLEADLHRMMPAIEEAQIANRHLQQLTEAIAILRTQAQHPNTLHILSTMTRLFPDDTWTYEFQLEGDEVHIAGFANDPSKLIGIINAEPLFGEAKFLSPVVTTNGMGQRFNLSFHVKAGDPK